MNVVRQEVGGAGPTLQLALWVTHILPEHVGNRLRVAALRAAGVAIGHGTVVGGGLTIVGGERPERRLSIGQRCWINSGCHFDCGAEIDIGDDVAIGQQTLVLTTTHRLGESGGRAGPHARSPVRIASGVWIGARATILPGVTVGRGSVVAAGAVVSTDVEPDTMVGGVPARLMRQLETDLHRHTELPQRNAI